MTKVSNGVDGCHRGRRDRCATGSSDRWAQYKRNPQSLCRVGSLDDHCRTMPDEVKLAWFAAARLTKLSLIQPPISGGVVKLPRDMSARAIVGMLTGLPILVGISVGLNWRDASVDYYANSAQIIVTLFIAVAIEFIVGREDIWEDELDRSMILGLITISWFGLFGCIQAMLDDGNALASGAAAAGLTAASVLVALTLLTAMRNLPAPPRTVTLLLLFPPVLFLVVAPTLGQM